MLESTSTIQSIRQGDKTYHLGDLIHGDPIYTIADYGHESQDAYQMVGLCDADSYITMFENPTNLKYLSGKQNIMDVLIGDKHYYVGQVIHERVVKQIIVSSATFSPYYKLQAENGKTLLEIRGKDIIISYGESMGF